MSKKKKSEKKETSWLEGLSNLPRERQTVFHYQNVECLKCGAIERDMIRVGCLYFCPICATDEFTTDNPVDDEREVYLKWLNKYKEEQERGL